MTAPAERIVCRCSHPRDQHTAAGTCRRWELGCLCTHFVPQVAEHIGRLIVAAEARAAA